MYLAVIDMVHFSRTDTQVFFFFENHQYDMMEQDGQSHQGSHAKVAHSSRIFDVLS